MVYHSREVRCKLEIASTISYTVKNKEKYMHMHLFVCSVEFLHSHIVQDLLMLHFLREVTDEISDLIHTRQVLNC